MYYSAGGWADAQVCYDYFTDYFQTGYFMSGPPMGFNPMFTPWVAVVDLSTANLLHKDTLVDYLNGAAEIISLIEQADQ